MPRKGQCAACLNRRLPEAEEMHRAGQSARAIAATTGISRNSFLRHVETCMTRGRAEVGGAVAALPWPAAAGVEPTVASAANGEFPAELPIGPDGDPLAGPRADRAEVYAALMAQFRAIEPGPAAARDVAALAPSLLRSIKDQETSLRGVEAPKGPAERMRENPSFVRYQDIVVRVLMRHPDVRAELAAALNEKLAEEGPW